MVMKVSYYTYNHFLAKGILVVEEEKPEKIFVTDKKPYIRYVNSETFFEFFPLTASTTHIPNSHRIDDFVIAEMGGTVFYSLDQAMDVLNDGVYKWILKRKEFYEMGFYKDDCKKENPPKDIPLKGDISYKTVSGPLEDWLSNGPFYLEKNVIGALITDKIPVTSKENNKLFGFKRKNDYDENPHYCCDEVPESIFIMLKSLSTNVSYNDENYVWYNTHQEASTALDLVVFVNAYQILYGVNIIKERENFRMVGDLVKLKGDNSPEMVIKQINKGMCRCVLWNGEKFIENIFNEKCLERTI